MVSEGDRRAIESAVNKILDEADIEKITERMVRSLAEKKTGMSFTREHKDIVKQCINQFLAKVEAEAEEEAAAEEERERERERERKAAKKRKGDGKAEAEEEDKDDDDDEEERRRDSKRSKSEAHSGGGGKGGRAAAKGGGGGGERTKGSQGEIIVCKLSDKRRVTVSVFKGKVYIGIREYYEKGGEMLPSAKGISLTVDQWQKLKDVVPEVQDVIKQRL